MFPTWKDLEAFPTWKDLLNHFQPLAEQAQQQMWLQYTEAMQKMFTMLAAVATGWEMFPTWKDLEAFSTWKDLQDYPTWNDLTDVERRAEQAQQQMWLEYSEVMQQTQAQVQALAYRLDLRLEELEAHQWLPELPPGLPQQRFIPHWSAAVGAAELAEGFPPIDLSDADRAGSGGHCQVDRGGNKSCTPRGRLAHPFGRRALGPLAYGRSWVVSKLYVCVPSLFCSKLKFGVLRSSNAFCSWEGLEVSFGA